MGKIKIKNQKGFSLLESIIGVFIAGTVFITFLEILPKMVVAESVARKTVVATNLAQEGIEKVRNIRDNNLKIGNGPFDSPFPTTTSNENPVSSTFSNFNREIRVSGSSSKTITSIVTWDSNSVTITDELSTWGQ